MQYQPIFDIAEICVRKNVTEVVLCPGSRCAPLTLAFTRHPGIRPRTFNDERSAGFIGLGIAQQSQQPVVLVCTSGSAAYNFAPSVAEAFFGETPLIVFTADRPAEWIAQHDGQTIFQPGIFGKHVKASFQLPQDYDHADSKWAVNRIVNEAINLSKQEPKGPVHINAPFREPLYPSNDEKTSYSKDVRVFDEVASESALSSDGIRLLEEEWKSAQKILVVVGQMEFDHGLIDSLRLLSARHEVVIAGDVISNIHQLEEIVAHTDLFLGQATDEVKKTLQPDLLITFGKSLVSKNLKLFLRKYPARNHWHLQAAGAAADTFKNLTHILPVQPKTFLQTIDAFIRPPDFELQKRGNYKNLWHIEERRVTRVLADYFPLQGITELEAVRELLQQLPDGATLHLANSMSVRYANFIGLPADAQVHVHANRGTSGIDGSSSTAVGHALSSSGLHFLITGDLAFFYDRNAYWHNYPIKNLRILLLNNHGGIIFNMIDGPASQPEAAEYFITRQKLKADKLCEEFGFTYLKPDNRRKLENYLKEFIEDDGETKVLEIETDLHHNRKVFDELKLKIKKTYEL